MIQNEDEIRDLYRRRAKRYDQLTKLYSLLGFRGRVYRRMAVEALNLKRGDTVIDIGCGTGLSFPYLRNKVGSEGKILGVDLSGDMLEQARQKCRVRGWSNVDLIQCDAGSFAFPDEVGGIISVFALRSIAASDRVIQRGAEALSPGRRFVVLDLKMPEKAPDLLKKLFVLFARPFGVSRELEARRLLESAENYLTNISIFELYFGFAYILTGEAPVDGAHREDGPTGQSGSFARSGKAEMRAKTPGCLNGSNIGLRQKDGDANFVEEVNLTG